MIIGAGGRSETFSDDKLKSGIFVNAGPISAAGPGTITGDSFGPEVISGDTSGPTPLSAERRGAAE